MFKPLFDIIVIKPLKTQEKTSTGILLPETSEEKTQIGEIVAIGDGEVDNEGKKLPMVVKVGQKVIYKKWDGQEVKIGEKKYIAISQKDLLIIL